MSIIQVNKVYKIIELAFALSDFLIRNNLRSAQ